MKETRQDSGSAGVDSLLERTILDVGIPPCPVILDRFMVEARKDEPDYQRLAGIIGTDVGVSASLIKTANSPFFGLRHRVRSVNEALAILGLNSASRAVAGIILRQAFSNVPNLERFWDASARVARLSGWLAQYFNIRGLCAEEAYTFGLFRDCGIPVLLGRFPRYEKVLAVANQDDARSFMEIEDAEMPTNHPMVGCILAQSWWLPEEICLSIRNHHDLAALESAHSSLPMKSRRLIATAQLAEHIVQRQLRQIITQEWPKLGAVCLQILELDEEHLEVLYAEAAPIAATIE